MPKLRQLFQNIPELSPSSELEKAILCKIELLEVAKAKRAKIWSLAGFAASIWVFAYVFGTFGGSLVQSEFWSIISLMFSDVQVVAANWQDFSYSAMETFPVVGTIAILIPAGLMFWSISEYFQWHGRFNQKLI